MYGKELKAKRIEFGYTQKQISEKTGIVQPNISAWENDLYSPNIEFCVKLADFYGITLDELIGREIEYNGAKNENIIKYKIDNITNYGKIETK